MKITYDHARLEDASRIGVLLKTTYIEAYATEGVTFEFVNFISNRFSVAYLEKNILRDPERFIVALFEDNPVGVLEINFNTFCPISLEKLPELSKLYVLSRFTRKGIGSVLLQKAEEKVLDKGSKEIWLEVWVENFQAITFYKKNGYEIHGIVDSVMEENIYQNYVMKKQLNIISEHP